MVVVGGIICMATLGVVFTAIMWIQWKKKKMQGKFTTCRDYMERSLDIVKLMILWKAKVCTENISIVLMSCYEKVHDTGNFITLQVL